MKNHQSNHCIEISDIYVADNSSVASSEVLIVQKDKDIAFIRDVKCAKGSAFTKYIWHVLDGTLLLL
jgi:hypothetical protein